jgi:putative ABC transport system ATP-binding protein
VSAPGADAVPTEASDEVAVRCVGLTRHYAGAGDAPVRALDGLDLVVPAGEFLAVTGPSGCGKTTFLNLLGALDTPSGGTLEVFGQPVAGLSATDRALYRRATVGFVFQQFLLIPTLTALENVALPLGYAGVPKGEARDRAVALLDRVGLAARHDHLPALLSGGEQQRVAVARALVTGARLLLADEPTGNLDGATAQQVVALLREHAADRTIVMVTHDPEVANLADRQLRLRDGRIDLGGVPASAPGGGEAAGESDGHHG